MQQILIIFIVIFSLIVLTTIFLYAYFHNPFTSPKKEITFDISNKKIKDYSDYENYIEEYLISNKIKPFEDFNSYYNFWIKEKENKKYIFKKHRHSQLQETIQNNNKPFRFIFIRYITKYKQVNYVKHAYKERQVIHTTNMSYDSILTIYNKLKEINFETTLNNYNSKEQRKLMTKELREQIAKRDNYTCKKCGKYMPDGVGLHIDHIIPVKKGGKSIPSNLQVLCSKCNGSKSDKL